MQTANTQNTASVDKSHLRRLGDYLLLSFASVFLKLHRVKSVRELPTVPPPRYESHLLRRRVAGWDSSVLKLRNVFIPPTPPKRGDYTEVADCKGPFVFPSSLHNPRHQSSQTVTPVGRGQVNPRWGGRGRDRPRREKRVQGMNESCLSHTTCSSRRVPPRAASGIPGPCGPPAPLKARLLLPSLEEGKRRPRGSRGVGA